MGEGGAEDSDIVVRRAPYADNPTVGARGQATQQRILEAALDVFGEVGYPGASVDRIASRAGCSRVALYQYFSGKEDVFVHVADRVGRAVRQAIEDLGPVTDGSEGREALRAWIAEYTAIHERFEPVFRAFSPAVESDEAMAERTTTAGDRAVERLRTRISGDTLPARRATPVIRLLLEVVTRTLDAAAVLRRVTPEAWPPEPLAEALADVTHRSLFGLRAGVNDGEARGTPPPPLRFSPAMFGLVQGDESRPDLTPTGQRTLASLLEAGADVLVRRGYHAARVDDVVQAAGLSHGAFYRYFANKQDLARTLGARAMRRVSLAFAEIPAGPDDDLRSWLARYHDAYAVEAAMIRVWVDASSADPELRADSAAAYDWGRRYLAGVLAPRGFGDHQVEALVVVALLSPFGSGYRTAATVDAAALVIERGLLGR